MRTERRKRTANKKKKGMCAGRCLFLCAGPCSTYLNQFLKNVRKYTDPEELTAEMVNELIDKIIVHAPDKSSGHRKQKIEIYYKAVGIINIATDEELIAEDGRKDRWHKQSA